jgi:hypothetical protein
MKDRYLKVENHSNLERDSVTNAILNTDEIAYSNYIKQRDQKLKEQLKIDSLKDELDHVKSEISEIKDLLLKIAKKPT